LEKFNENIDWLESDTQKLAETSKQPAVVDNSIAIEPAKKCLTPEEIQEQYVKGGEAYLNQVITQLDKETTVQKPRYSTTPEQEKMLNLFRQNCSTEFVVSQFSK
jgi:predicted RNA-binding protein Jag